ncbi:MAG TPA: diaminopropionate ammonia-lyase [Sphingobium sp.]
MTIQIVRNTVAADRSAHPRQTILSLEGAQAALAEISTWPGYEVTPMRELTPVSEACRVRSVFYKDEASRFGLSSFKALGGTYAVARLLQRRVSEQLGRAVSTVELASGAHSAITRTLTVVSATDGNHGRAVAAGAAMFGCSSVILIHSGVSAAREQAIAARGAHVIRIDGNYDDSVRAAAHMAIQDGWALIADTSSDGGEAACVDVMHGYTVMVAEALDQISALGSEQPSHIFVQGGVGGLAAAACAYTWLSLAESAPIVIVVEPELADCLYQSAKAGIPTPSTGNLDTVMAGLSCGEVSEYAWHILREGAEFFQLISDDEAIAAMRLLADEDRAGAPIVAGESAGAGLAGFMAAAADPQTRRALRLDPASRILLFGTEGATDPELYATLLGRPATDDGAAPASPAITKG